MKFIRKIASCFVLVLLVLSFPSAQVFAQGNASLQAAAPADAAESTQVTSAIEIAVLKAQLVTMQSFTDRLLATVYWSLGTLFVVASLMVGFGWFTTFRIHEREILALRTDLTGQLTSQTMVARTDIEKMVQVRFTEINASVVTLVKSTTIDLVKPVDDAAIALRTSVEQLQKDLATTALQSEAWYWEYRQVPSNELSRYHEMLVIAIQARDMHAATSTLEHIKKLLVGGAAMYATNRIRLSALLDKLPNEFADIATSIREALKSTKNT